MQQQKGVPKELQQRMGCLESPLVLGPEISCTWIWNMIQSFEVVMMQQEQRLEGLPPWLWPGGEAARAWRAESRVAGPVTATGGGAGLQGVALWRPGRVTQGEGKGA